MRVTRGAIAAAGMVVACSAPGLAQTTVVLPDTSQTSTVSVSVSEQARVVVPGSISFNVTNVRAATAAAATAIAIDQIVLSSVTKQLRVSVRANAAAFTPPVAAATTWIANDVSWNAATWTAAAGVSGTLSDAAFTTVATCDPGAAGCSTAGLVFTLAPKPAVQRSGAHTLVVTWKVESIGS